MKYALTNLVFPEDIDSSFLRKLSDNLISGIEVAPTKIANWNELTDAVLCEFKYRLADHELKISSLQSLFYGLENCQLLGDGIEFDNMVEHFKKIIDIANTLDAKICLFGSPKSRLRLNIENNQALDIAALRLQKIAEIFQANDIILVVESIPKQYSCDFLTNYKDVLSLITSINNPNLKIHLDIGCVTLADDIISDAVIECGKNLYHYQASENNISNFNRPQFLHKSASKALNEIKYKGWVAIEMIGVQEMQDILNAINYVTSVYV